LSRFFIFLMKLDINGQSFIVSRASFEVIQKLEFSGINFIDLSPDSLSKKVNRNLINSS
jgi:hypothetical protein